MRKLLALLLPLVTWRRASLVLRRAALRSAALTSPVRPIGPVAPGCPSLPWGMPKLRCTAAPSKLACTVAMAPGLIVVTLSTSTLAKGGPCGPASPLGSTKAKCSSVPTTSIAIAAGSPGAPVVTESTTAEVTPGTASISDFRPVSCARICAAELGEWSAGRSGSKGIADQGFQSRARAEHGLLGPLAAAQGPA